MDRDAVRQAVADFLKALGHATEGELAHTPELVAEAWCNDLLEGEASDPVALLEQSRIPVHGSSAGGCVTLRDIAVTTMCPHHLMPAHGTADIAYLPGDAVAGFGAIIRALRAATRRLTLQETAGACIADALVSALGAKSAVCRLRMHHTCLIMRGAREHQASIETLAFAGAARDPGGQRDLLIGALSS